MTVPYSRSRAFKNVQHLRTTIDFGSYVAQMETPKKANKVKSNVTPNTVGKLQSITRKHTSHKPTSIVPYEYTPVKDVNFFISY